MRAVLPQRSTGFCHYQLSIFSSDMASRSPAIFLLLALPLLCYVVSIEAHTLPDDIVPDSRGLSDTIVPESSLDDDEMDEFMQATSRSRLTKGGGQSWEDQQEWLQARAAEGLNDGLLQSRLTKMVRTVRRRLPVSWTQSVFLHSRLSGSSSKHCQRCRSSQQLPLLSPPSPRQ